MALAVDGKAQGHAAQREQQPWRLREQRASQLREAEALERPKVGPRRVNLGAEQPGLLPLEAQQLAPERAARKPEPLEQPALQPQAPVLRRLEPERGLRKRRVVQQARLEAWQALDERRERPRPWLAVRRRPRIARRRRRQLVPEWCYELSQRRPPGSSWNEFFSPRRRSRAKGR